jgi:hypothetical protein
VAKIVVDFNPNKFVMIGFLGEYLNSTKTKGLLSVTELKSFFAKLLLLFVLANNPIGNVIRLAPNSSSNCFYFVVSF